MTDFKELREALSRIDFDKPVYSFDPVEWDQAARPRVIRDLLREHFFLACEVAELRNTVAAQAECIQAAAPERQELQRLVVQQKAEVASLASAREVQDAALVCARNDFRELANERDALAAEVAELRAKVAALETGADMFWDADDPETAHNEIDDMVADYDVGTELKVWRAMRLPSIKVRVVADPETGDNTYEVIDAARSQGDGGGAGGQR